MKLALIPARGGSKRIPRKNVKSFHGKPMIAWSIEAAKKANCFDKIVVSTDDEEIAEVARLYGAEVPFMRPKAISDDHTGTTKVVAHALDWYQNKDTIFEVACCIYATAPFVLATDLQQSLKILQDTKSDYVFAAAQYPAAIERAFTLNHNKVSVIHEQHVFSRSQDLTPAYFDAGQFYWGKTQSWLNETHPYVANSSAFVLPHHRVQDIDTLEDWQRAELLFALLLTTNGLAS